MGRREEFESEVNKKNFVRALYLAKELDFPEEQIKQIAYKALWQVAGIGRNPYATKKLALELGYSKDQLKQILMEQAGKEKEQGDKKIVGPCYDYRSGKYLTFEEWLTRFLKEWNKIN
jgi:ABC-type Fe2+-enterobactin transport system substrate-binding protein